MKHENYFLRPEVAELVSAKLAPGLESRLFRTFLSHGLDPFETMDRDEDLLAAARDGRLGAAEWLYNAMKEAPEPGDPLIFAHVCAEAASGGNIDVLRFLRENGCPWDESTCILAATTV